MSGPYEPGSRSSGKCESWRCSISPSTESCGEPDARFRKVGERLRRSGRETIAEHRKTTKGFRLGRLVLNNVPVLGELAVFDSHDIDGDP
jgi:hypothetical protein